VMGQLGVELTPPGVRAELANFLAVLAALARTGPPSRPIDPLVGLGHSVDWWNRAFGQHGDTRCRGSITRDRIGSTG
jgi:hypothetical protein